VCVWGGGRASGGAQPFRTLSRTLHLRVLPGMLRPLWLERSTQPWLVHCPLAAGITLPSHPSVLTPSCPSLLPPYVPLANPQPSSRAPGAC
jgi:hypothetical protein